ncbi:hypothetical protein L249_8769 [Ophiocordyceps polyrhachis-furcata BCC 54312]|uniref:DUF788 domain-containing protein n=1 Tax=Ophiocordyceps polyrhachis-furcata BCC 54312 TaxID=1330021 RepID=A0A367L1M9_9HYPO|nr:hypothetical protein L249_8769 [Ophiocordyceps polyrhachis-furcata BCC 54312]
MAQKAKKDLAKNNAAALNRLHLISVLANGLFLVSHLFLRRRSLLVYGLLSLPAFVCQYVLEISGRPKYDAITGALKSSGQDLAARGLTEYMFDVVWVTWVCCAAVMLAGNWAWLLWAVIPAYGVYLGAGLLGMGRQQLAGMQAGQDAAPPANRRARRAV